MHRHVYVCREHRHEQGDEPPSGPHCPPLDQEQDPEGRLGEPANIDQFEMPRQVSRHDVDVKARVDKVISARSDEEPAEQVSCQYFEASHLRLPRPRGR